MHLCVFAIPFLPPWGKKRTHNPWPVYRSCFTPSHAQPRYAPPSLFGGTYGQHSPKMGINTPPGVIIAPLFPPNSAIVTYAAFLWGVTRALHPALHRCSFPLLGLISKKKETYGTLTLLFFSHKIRCNVPTRGSAFTLVIVRHLHGPLPLSGSFPDILRSTVFC
jgi:hypothetical protein